MQRLLFILFSALACEISAATLHAVRDASVPKVPKVEVSQKFAAVTRLAQAKQQYRVRVDFVVTNGKRCAGFHAASKPKQSKAPAAAYRWAFKSLMTSALKTRAIPARVIGVSWACDDPPPSLKSPHKRLRMMALFSPMTYDQLANEDTGLINSYLELEAIGAFTDAFLSKSRAGNSSIWAPRYVNYKVPGKTPVCVLGFPGCFTAWNPTKIEFLEDF